MKDTRMTNTMIKNAVNVLLLKTGMGKTTQLIERAVKEYNEGNQVLYVSLELNHAAITNRLANASKMVKRDTSILEVLVLPAHSTIDAIIQRIEMYRAKSQYIDVLVIDYLDLVNTTNSNSTVLEELNKHSSTNGYVVYTAQQIAQ